MKDLSGKVYYGMHFQPGVAQYSSKEGSDGKPLMVYVNEETAKKMDQTFPGRPVFVNHKTEFNEEDFKNSDGYVAESFFNKSDGNHWVKFIVTTDEGEKAIKDGYRLSNCYTLDEKGKSGSWHGVDYDYKILNGTYEHLALVKNPRYEESKILTPDQFKKYNEDKHKELEKLQNEKGKEKLFFVRNVKPKVEKKANSKAPAKKRKSHGIRFRVTEKKVNSMEETALRILASEMKNIRKRRGKQCLV